MSDSNSPSKTFLGVRFVLYGFDPVNKNKVRSKLVNGGGVDDGQYSENCTHVIVDKIVYDDPLFVAARSNGKTLVTGLWVDHSFDIGMPVDPTSIMYRPCKDLNGIPGAKSLIVCLTGYQRQDRDDIMTMVGLMGAQFSKPLVANKVTHLICYKFEGEKYELARKMKNIKLVNHRWLEDCLRDWELRPEANYNKSGYELEMMEAEAKDSEEEAEDTTVKQHEGKDMNKSPDNFKVGMLSASELPMPAEEVPKVLPIPAVHKDLLDVSIKYILLTPGKGNISHQVSSFDNVNLPEAHGCQLSGAFRDGPSVDLLEAHDRTPNSTKVDNEFASTCKSAKSPCCSDAKNKAISYSRKTPSRSSLSMFSRDMSGNLKGSPEANLGELKVDVFDISSPKVEHSKERVGSGSVDTPQKGSESCNEEKSSGIIPQKRKKNVSGSSSKSQKMGRNAKACIAGSPSISNRTQGLEATSLVDGPLKIDNCLSLDIDGHSVNETANLNAAQCVSITKPSSFNEKSLTHNLPLFKSVAPETWQNKNADEKAPQTSPNGPRELDLASKPDIGDFVAGRSAFVVGERTEPLNQQQDVGLSSSSNRKSEMEDSHRPVDLDMLEGRNDTKVAKPLNKKTIAKKTLGSRPKRSNNANKKGSIYSDKIAFMDPATCLSGCKERADHEKFYSANELKTSPLTISVEAQEKVEKKSVPNSEGDTMNKIKPVDDETEPPEEKDEDNFEKALNREMFEVVKSTHKIDTMMEMNSGLQHVANKSKSSSNAAMASEEGVNGTEPENKVCAKNFGLGESTFKGDGVKGKIKKRKKRPSAKAKMETVPAVTEMTESKKDIDGEETRSGKSIEEKEMKSKTDPAGQTRSGTLSAHKLENSMEVEKENRPVVDGDQNLNLGKQHVGKSVVKSKNTPMKVDKKSEKISYNSAPVEEVSNRMNSEPFWFILSGHRLQRKEFQQAIRRLKGRFCRDSHQWSYQATHFIAPDPIRRTEKFFAAAASGRWILGTDYLSACSQAGKFIAEEPYEWHKSGLSEDGAINLEAPRKWRLLRERTGHGAFYGMRIIVYGECIAPPLDTLKRVVKAGDGTILATSPPYTRFFKSGVDFAIVSPGMPRVDLWVQEFLNHEIPCVVADYLVEYVCKPGYSLERHVLYNTHAWAERSFSNLLSRAEEIVEDMTPPNDSVSNDISCQVCGSRDRGEVMLICGDESGSIGCGVGTHIDCCDPPLEDVPEEDWLCPNCCRTRNSSNPPKKKKKGTSVLTRK